MRIERTGPLDAGSNTAALYRIILNFTIQFTIKGFDRDQESKRHNRIFDSVGRSMESWRGGLVFERYPPSAALTPERGRSGFFSRWTPSAADESPPPLFRVLSRHPERCYCRVPRAGDDRCRHRSSRRHAYDRCASWTGQTQAQLHMWTPEIYQNRNCVHTITREVDAAAVDALLARRTMRGLAELRRLLHFDLDVEVRLREIGWGLWGRLRPVSKPAEIRAKDDAGRPLPADRARICITCCPESINWPERETRDLQAEVEDQVARMGYVRRLRTSEEYQEPAPEPILAEKREADPGPESTPEAPPAAEPEPQDDEIKVEFCWAAYVEAPEVQSTSIRGTIL
ncbi:hypothetical protein P8C59_005956 [Phyllachora maydis]|uniref:Rieske domain-containing protein n=1 Tax=Phyllachora maydis TaxID=1825666 RepID=A0AAD9I5F7_9PEZI|nr:hypothetical protein P8C59_005956 [Phyllachora maydis]